MPASERSRTSPQPSPKQAPPLLAHHPRTPPTRLRSWHGSKLPNAPLPPAWASPPPRPLGFWAFLPVVPLSLEEESQPPAPGRTVGGYLDSRDPRFPCLLMDKSMRIAIFTASLVVIASGSYYLWNTYQANLEAKCKEKDAIASAFRELVIQASPLQDKEPYNLAIVEYNKAVQDCIGRGKPI